MSRTVCKYASTHTGFVVFASSSDPNHNARGCNLPARVAVAPQSSTLTAVDPPLSPHFKLGTMYFQPALASSAFAGFYDELLAYFTLFCEPRDLLQLAQTNSGKEPPASPFPHDS